MRVHDKTAEIDEGGGGDATDVMEVRQLPPARGPFPVSLDGRARIAASLVLALLVLAAIVGAYVARDSAGETAAGSLDPSATTSTSASSTTSTSVLEAQQPQVASTLSPASSTSSTTSSSTSTTTGPTTTSSTVAPQWTLIQRFDFGPRGAPTNGGYFGVSPADPGPFTIAGGGIRAGDRGGPDDLRSDFVFADGPRVFGLPADPGTYRVTVILGDQDFVHDEMVVTVESTTLATGVTVAAGDFTTVVGEVEVFDRELSVGLNVAGGTDPNWVLNAMIIEVDAGS